MEELLASLSTENEEAQQIANSPKRFRLINIEPTIILIFFSISVSGVVFQNQIIYQTCMSHFGYNESECSMLGKLNASKEVQEIELIVNPYAAKIFMSHTMIRTIIPVFMCVFIGSWSDKFGRKPLIFASSLGYFLCNLIITIIAIISNNTIVSPWFYTLAFIPMSLTGANCTLFTGIFCYVSDTSTVKNRALKMTLLEAALNTGVVLGLGLSSYILNLTTPITIFAIATIGCLLALLYTSCFVAESVDLSSVQEKGFEKLFALFNADLVPKMFATCFKKRNNWDRTIIWLAIIPIGSTVFVFEGSLTVFYLYIQEKFKWTLQEYTIFNAAAIVMQVIGNIIAILIFKKLFGTPDSILGFLGFLSGCVNNVIQRLANDSWELWMGSGISILKGIATPMCRAILANIVPPNEIGAVYSLTASIENVTPLASAPLYSYVYGATVSTDPAAFSYISASVFTYCALFLLWIYILQKRYPPTNYESLRTSD